MRELTLIFTDLYLEHDATHASVWPRLPAFEGLLARGAVTQSGDWRTWIWRRIGLPPGARIPVAALTRHARSAEAEQPGQCWLAHSVQLAPGVDRVYLLDLPRLADEEWRALEAGFNATFSSAGFTLVDGQAGHAFLLSAADLDCETIDPARVRGRDILAALPTGPGAAVLKRLMTEIQMWLHAHPVNIARQDRGAGELNGLWIWGAGQWPLDASVAPLPILHSEDGFLRGLWKSVGGVSERVPQSFQALDAARDDAMIIALPGAASVPSAPQTLEKLEHDWLQAALTSLRRGRIARLELHVNDRLVSLTRPASWRWWLRRRPWPQGLT